MADESSPPATMRAWQYNSTKGGIDANLKLNLSAPTPKPKAGQHLVKIHSVSLNPIDYKPGEIPLVGRLIVPKAATPCNDFAGTIAVPAAGSDLKKGDLVFGAAGTNPVAGGALAEYAISMEKQTVRMPDGLEPDAAATIGVAGMTAYQSIVTRVKKGERVFINGGSGGTGVFGVQMAKAAGCHVTATCSGANVEMVKSLGADEVIDYTKENVVDVLVTKEKFDHAVDNVGKDPSIFWRCHEYLKPDKEIVVVGGEPSLSGGIDMVKRKLLPKTLGGIKGKVSGFWPVPNTDDLAQIVSWMKEGKVNPSIEHKYPFDEAPEAFKRLKTRRTKGKLIIGVSDSKPQS